MVWLVLFTCMASPRRRKTVLLEKSDLVSSPVNDCPEELQIIWDDKVAEAFHALRPKQQDFLLHYLNCGNAAASYRKAYNPMATDAVSSANGSRLVASDSMGAVLEKFINRKTEALFTVANTYFEMTSASKAEWHKDELGQYENIGDVPDWRARKDGADGLCKLYGLCAPAQVKTEPQVHGRVVIVQLPKKQPIPGTPIDKQERQALPGGL